MCSGYGAGFDFGTSGVRTTVIDTHGAVQFESSLKWAAPDDPVEWLRALEVLLGEMPEALRSHMSRICVSGTSASCLLVSAEDSSHVTRSPRMYGYNTLTELPALSDKAFCVLEGLAPAKHTTLASA
ncbi:unnamed protein product [Discosporangium mesarthrocarpum]